MRCFWVYIRTRDDTSYSEVLIGYKSHIAINKEGYKECIFKGFDFVSKNYYSESSANLILAFLSEDENTINLKEIGSTNKFDINKPIQDYAKPGKYKLYRIPDELLRLTKHIKPNLMFKLDPYER